MLLYSLEGEYLGVGKRYQRELGSAGPSPAPPASKPQHDYLELLIQKHERSLRQRSQGIDYLAVLAQAGHRWPFTEFVQQLAAQLARPGGLTAFSTDELERLQKTYQRLPSLDAALLRQACEQAQQRTIPDIVFQLQQLASSQERGK